MQKDTIAFIGLDTSKMKISVALAENGRQGEVRFFGDIDSTPDAVRRLVSKLSGRYSKLSFCYEAGPTGYGLHRQIVDLGHDCTVIAPLAYPETTRRPGKDKPTRRSHPRSASSGWRIDGNLGARSGPRGCSRSRAGTRSRHERLA